MRLKTYWFAMRCHLNALHTKKSVSSVHRTHLSTIAEQAKLRRHHLAFVLFIFFNYSSPQLVLISLIATLFFNNFHPFPYMRLLYIISYCHPVFSFLSLISFLFYCHFFILLLYLISNIIMWYVMLLKCMFEYYFKLYY